MTGLAWLLETETVTGNTNTRMHLHPPMKNPSLSSSPNCDSLVPSSNALAGLTVDLAAVLEFCLRLLAIASSNSFSRDVQQPHPSAGRPTHASPCLARARALTPSGCANPPTALRLRPLALITCSETHTE